MISGETWQSLGEVVVFASIGGYAAWKARRADQQTRATGNGFAADVKARLASIEQKIDDRTGDLERKIDGHLAAHVEASLKSRSD